MRDAATCPTAIRHRIRVRMRDIAAVYTRTYRALHSEQIPHTKLWKMLGNSGLNVVIMRQCDVDIRVIVAIPVGAIAVNYNRVNI